MNYVQKLQPRDISDIAYDVEEISIFFDTPITFSILERPDLGEKTVGSGLGGFSWTFFQRGAECTMCGNCCKSTYRNVWFWWHDEPHPDSVEACTLVLNGHNVPIFIHYNSEANGMQRCDFLVDTEVNGVVLGLCGLHEAGIKPNHCRQHPMSSVHNVHLKDGVIPLISRRLPSRNWRWPKCPVDVAKVPMSADQMSTDRAMLKVWEKALWQVPGSHVVEARTLWEVTSGRILPQTSNLLFKDGFEPR